MVIEILTLVVNAAKLLQGFQDRKRDPAGMSKDLEKLLDTLSPLYSLLQQAKNVHDFLEQVSHDVGTVADPPNGSPPELVSTTAKSICRRIRANPHSLTLPEVHVATPEELERAGFSPIIHGSMTELMGACPSASNSLKLLNKDFSAFCDLVDKRNFGREFEASAILTNDHTTQARFDADKIIFHLVPILTELFHQTKLALR